jgi:ABC-type spermidine/putrescine transport system permease subunit I
LFALLGLCFFGSIARVFVDVFSSGFDSVYFLFKDILSRRLFGDVALRTFRVSVIVTVVTVAIGYATAYAMWRSSPRTRVLLIGMILFPLFTSVVVRSYAWVVLFNRYGMINSLLLDLGLVDQPLRLIKTEFAVLVGMIQLLLPFAILPIFAILSRLDENLLRASAIAGARGWQTFVHVILPLSRKGTAVASTLVFVLCLGFFVTPAILGGPRSWIIANLIGTEITTFLDLRDGSAMALMLLAVTLVLLASISNIGGIKDHFKGQNR